MEDYKHVQNLYILGTACNKMLKEKFNITLSDEKIQILIEEVSREVLQEYGSIQLKTHQLNNITLSKIKNMYTNQFHNQSAKPSYLANHQSLPLHSQHQTSTQQLSQQPPEQLLPTQPSSSEQILNTQSSPSKSSSYPSTPTNVDILDDDMINHKLKELEARRKIIPNYSYLPSENQPEIYESNTPQQQNIIYKANPISITLPSVNDKIHYKNFIINSLNRDWARNIQRNNIKFNISVDVYSNSFYPQCICFPSFVKNITPYVLMNITDNSKNIFYSFTCNNTQVNSKWDTWYPVDDVENISLQNKTWSIKFYDFMNNELDLGSDNISIMEVSSKNDKEYILKIQLPLDSYDNNFNNNDNIYIRTYNGKVYNKKITDYVKAERNSDGINIMTIIDDNNELVMDDFINSKILNTNNQYSFIIKYCFNKI
jgi:hypothetical protein